MVNNPLKLLKSKLEESSPSLFLGAGFSYDAVNDDGQVLPLGNALKNSLIEEFYINSPPDKKSEEYIDQVIDESLNKDLKYVCKLLRSEGRIKERNDYLTKTFRGCIPDSKNPYQKKIVEYPWYRIFTLNIDDLVENIYKYDKSKKLLVWNNSDKGSFASSSSDPLLIKLHGDVNDEEAGYVFDNDEYNDFLAREDCLLHEFADAFTETDMIFIGTEFQEDDMRTMLTKYYKIGYRQDERDYFFVSPHINDIAFKNELESEANVHLHWIKMNTADFLDFLSREIKQKDSIRHPLKSNGAVFMDEITRYIPKPYHSDLYSGFEPQWDDFFENWDIIYPDAIAETKKAIKSIDNTLVVLHGKSYSGKTCVGSRILIDFMHEGFNCFQLTRCSDDILYLVEKYIESYEEDGRKIAFVLEDAAFYYEHIIRMLNVFKNADVTIIPILIDTENNFESKVHILKNSKVRWLDLPISEEIGVVYAENVFSKLDDKGRLGEFLKFLGTPASMKNKKSVIQEMKRLNDIIAVLYYAEKGVHFQKHFERLIFHINQSSYYPYLQILVFLSQLGINHVQIRILSKMLPDFNNFDINTLKELLDNFVDIKNGILKLRCARILKDIVGCEIKAKDIIRVIKLTVAEIIGQFTEYNRNDYYDLFQKILNTKKIVKQKFLKYEDFYSFLLELYNSDKRIGYLSYFWIQFGIAAQECREFGEANSYFLKAQSIRPNSYQVAHAIAKNNMERGIFEIEKGDKPNSLIHYSQGKNQMKELIESDRFSRAFQYSIHAFIDLTLKYSKVSKERISLDDCAFIEMVLDKQFAKNIDSLLVKISKNYIDYCRINGLNKFIHTTIQNLRKASVYASEDEYDVNGWLDDFR